MRRATFILISVLIAANLYAAPKETKSNTKPDAGGVVIEPSEGEIAAGAELTITFPNAMAGTDKIDMSGQPFPFMSQPKIEGDFLWKSQTEGVFKVKAVVAGATHRLTLVRDLKDASGTRVDAPSWSAEFSAAPFSITSDFTEQEQLDSQPQIPLDSTYNVRLTEVAEHAYFQDRDSRQRFPVDVILRSDEKLSEQPEAQEFRVAPRPPLPMGRTYDLIINGLLDAKTRRPLPYLKVLPAGKTVPLKVEWAVAYNAPFEEPTIESNFSDAVDPREITADRIHIEPAVKDMQLLPSGDGVTIKGKFDLTQRHRVTISPEIKGERGYGLAEQSRWGATFHPQEPTILFPASQIFLRARPELRFTFFQVNTPAVTWKLARIPIEKLPAVNMRVREFEKDALDPVTGKVIVDPRTGFNKQFQTELLVDGFNLQVVACSTSDAASGDGKKQRDIHWKSPKGEALSGAYLLEASATLGDGRIIGNRSIICTSDFILTQKRTPTKVIMRVTKMSEAQSVVGMTVRAVTNENIEIARAITDAKGIATFDRDKVFPAKDSSAHLFIADAPNAPAIQFAEAETYPSGGRGGLAAKPHAEIINDRNLYRPGQSVKMKGIVRNVYDYGLANPTEV